jgi:hypothetical protein
MAKAQGAARSAPRTDDVLVREATAALEARLGTEGMLRFLRLLGGGRDRYEEIRRPLVAMSAAELEARLRARVQRRPSR